MIVIRDKSMVPKDHFNYTVPQTQHRFSANNFTRLVALVQRHMTANNVPEIPDLARHIEEDYCKRYQFNCVDTDNPVPPGMHDDVMTKLAAAVAIPMADALSKVSKALGINCARCGRRHEVISKVEQIGFTEAVRLIKETMK